MPRPRPWLLLILIAGLLLQYAAAGALDLRYGEPWPALVLPAFQTVRGDTDTVTTLRPQLQVHFDDGPAAPLAVATWLGELPRSHHGRFMRTFFCPAALCGTHATERGAMPEAACWTRERLQERFPDADPTRLTVTWERLTYRPPGREPARIDPQGTFTVDLASCHAAID